MAEMPNINATLRTGTGKGAARQARRDGLVPGVVYGGGKDPIAINLKFNELFKQLKAGKFLSTLMTIDIDGTKHNVLCRDVQKDVVKGLPIHIDFMQVSRRSKVQVFIPINFYNEEDAVGIKKGGSLVMVRSEVELSVPATHIPEKLEFDMINMDVGDVIHISDIALPEDASVVIDDRDFVIATLDAPRNADADDTEDAAEDAAPAEGTAEEE